MSELADLFIDVVRLHQELWNGIDVRLRAELDLPLTCFLPMQIIVSNRPCRVVDIATQLRITVGGASKRIDRIEAAGLCRRLPDPGDRRSSNLELTSVGDLQLNDASIIFEDELQRIVGSVLSPTAVGRLGRALAETRAMVSPAGLDHEPGVIHRHTDVANID